MILVRSGHEIIHDDMIIIFFGQLENGALKPELGVSQLSCGLLGRPTEGSDKSFI